jgi:hypothetical protein
MAHVIDDQIWACTSCFDLVAGNCNGGFEKERRRLREYANKYAGVAKDKHYDIGNGHIDFSWQTCDVCKQVEGGPRYQLILLGD